jgi:trehalose dimycolate hydrolase
VSINRLSRSVSQLARTGRWSRGFRWLGLGAAPLLAAGVLLAAPTAVPSAGADNCPDVALTFARGTDEPPGLGRVGQSLADDLRQNTGKNIDAYPVNYKASLLQLHGGDGANDAIKHIKDVADKCPNTPQVLGGYSQGASVIDIVTGVPIGGIGWGSSLPPQYASNVVAVTTFGNPADRSGGPISQQSQLFGAKAIDFCNPEDPICHAGPGNQWSGHTEGYVPVYTSQAASFIQTRLLSVLAPSSPQGPMGFPPGPMSVPPGPMGVPPGPQGVPPGPGQMPGPGPEGSGPTVVGQTQPTAFR